MTGRSFVPSAVCGTLVASFLFDVNAVGYKTRWWRLLLLCCFSLELFQLWTTSAPTRVSAPPPVACRAGCAGFGCWNPQQKATGAARGGRHHLSTSPAGRCCRRAPPPVSSLQCVAPGEDLANASRGKPVAVLPPITSSSRVLLCAQHLAASPRPHHASYCADNVHWLDYRLGAVQEQPLALVLHEAACLRHLRSGNRLRCPRATQQVVSARRPSGCRRALSSLPLARPPLHPFCPVTFEWYENFTTASSAFSGLVASASTVRLENLIYWRRGGRAGRALRTGIRTVSCSATRKLSCKGLPVRQRRHLCRHLLARRPHVVQILPSALLRQVWRCCFQRPSNTRRTVPVVAPSAAGGLDGACP